MKWNGVLNDLDGTLVVSCQCYEDEPLYSCDCMVQMAQAAMIGGAQAIRANGEDIERIKTATNAIVIGINKRKSKFSEVIITPTITDCIRVANAQADIIAIDATSRVNENGVILREYIHEIKQVTKKLVMADISNFEEARLAILAGADIVSTTLSGYTSSSLYMDNPDVELVKQIRKFYPSVFINAEGRYETKEQVLAAFQAGANCVTVGSAITRPQCITKRIVDYINDNQGGRE